MIQQFPDSTFVPRAKQRLREVQEVLAERQYQIGTFYASHENWAASIARLQTVTDSYPLYSHSDLALIGLGDAYAAEARFVQGLAKISPKAKQELMKAYDDQAADAYSRVITHYSMAPHVEDARERLIALNRAVPEPTKEELADSEAEEQSRTGITFKDRALLLVKRGPVTVNAARIGEPTLVDPPQVTAPAVHKHDADLFNAALQDKPLPAAPALGPPPAAVASAQQQHPRLTPAHRFNWRMCRTRMVAHRPAAHRLSEPKLSVQVKTAQPARRRRLRLRLGKYRPQRIQGQPRQRQQPECLAPRILADWRRSARPTINRCLRSKSRRKRRRRSTMSIAHRCRPERIAAPTRPTAKSKKKTPAPKYDSSDESSSKHKKKKGLDKLNPF